MYKSISTYLIPKNVDPQEFWEYHTGPHARDVVGGAGPELKRYVVNRVTDVIRGEMQFWGLIEKWWESKESRDEYLRRAKFIKGSTTGMSPPEEFRSRAYGGFGAWVEEREIPLL
ncbi:MAG: hypothetical protein HYY32_04340 [Chloroflexi bacterium]|nr:hypothetical protein [Chloroflexota bacterium]